MRVCIRRGAKEIGGTCVEIESQRRRLVLDIGTPLNAEDPAKVELPSVPGFEKNDPSLLGIVISHPHVDHYGLAFRIPKTTTFLMGVAAERILSAAAVFTESGGKFDHVIHLSDRNAINLGPFVITPFIVDHSAYDSYALLVEADGKSLFYTGDLRGHGRKAAVFDRLVAHPPENVDVLLMEGTTIKRHGTEDGFPTEKNVENDLVRIFRATEGMPLVWCSGQNIDRIVTVFRAAKRSNRQLIIDMYTAHILRATGNPNIPQADWAEVRVFLPKFQKARVKRKQTFDVSAQYRKDRIFQEDLAGAASHSVMLFRPSMCQDVEVAKCLSGSCLVYSMWDGYLAEDKLKPFLVWLDRHGIPMHKRHTSGHAPLSDLKRLRSAFGSAVVVPVHCAEPQVFANAFDRVALHPDNEWWEINGNEHKEATQ